MGTRICIVGCGSIGSIFGAHLAQLGDVEVHGYDLWREHTRAIRTDGLRVTGAAEFAARFHATSDAREIPQCDFGIVATKSTHTRAAIKETANIFGSSSAVCSVQNGLGNEEILADHTTYVMRGATFFAAHMVSAGHVSLDSLGDTWLGPFEPTHTPYSYVERLAELMYHAGLRPVPLADARGAQWAKLIFNAAINPVGALTRLHHGAATHFAPTNMLFDMLIEEGEAVARALNIQLQEDPRALVQKGADAPGKHNASMLQDAAAKRETEVDFLNGSIAAWGKKLGVPTPINRAMWQLIKGLEHSWTNPE